MHKNFHQNRIFLTIYNLTIYDNHRRIDIDWFIQKNKCLPRVINLPSLGFSSLDSTSLPLNLLRENVFRQRKIEIKIDGDENYNPRDNPTTISRDHWNHRNGHRKTRISDSSKNDPRATIKQRARHLTGHPIEFQTISQREVRGEIPLQTYPFRAPQMHNRI